MYFSTPTVNEWGKTYPEQAKMCQGEDSRPGTHIRRDLQREVLVEPTRGVRGRLPGPSVKHVAKLISRLWAHSLVAVVYSKSNADLNARS